ncbi:histone-lysine N-methyltransferase PRDM9-like protein [Aphelenchoides avenae]|nr:histone-lysine N-methyltransferase PRDM9-like protein [Aphelenchus avenae]
MLDRPVRRPLTDAEQTLADMERDAVARWIWQENQKKKRARTLNKQHNEYLEEQAAKELLAARKAFYTLQEESEEEYDYEVAYVKEEPDTEMAADIAPLLAGPFSFVDTGEFHDLKREPQDEHEGPSAEQSCEDFVITGDAADNFYQLCVEALVPSSDEYAEPDKAIVSNPVPEVAKSCEDFDAAGGSADKQEEQGLEPTDDNSRETGATIAPSSQPNAAMEESFEDFLILTDPADALEELFEEVPVTEKGEDVAMGKENEGGTLRVKVLEYVFAGEHPIKNDDDFGADIELAGSGSRENGTPAKNLPTFSKRSLPAAPKRFGCVIFDDEAEEKQEPQQEQEDSAVRQAQVNGNDSPMQTEPGSSALEETGMDANSTEKDFEKCLTRPIKKRVVRRPNCAFPSPHGTNCPNKHAFAKQRHGQTHASEHPYRCAAAGCAKSFVRKDHLEDYLQTHADRKRKARVNKEARKIEDKPKNKSPCRVCGRVLASGHMSRHMRSHTGERPYSCTVCAKSFRRAQHCLNHMLRVHTGERPFKCGTCSAGFVRRWDLTRHSKVHTGVNSIFPCKTCGRAFSRNYACMNHSKKCQAN